jgi:hypothetical protein
MHAIHKSVNEDLTNPNQKYCMALPMPDKRRSCIGEKLVENYGIQFRSKIVPLSRDAC